MKGHTQRFPKRWQKSIPMPTSKYTTFPKTLAKPYANVLKTLAMSSFVVVHGPCGERKKDSACMENNFCTKKYPKPWAETTSINEDGYPVYRRRKNGLVVTVNGIEMDRRDVVPHNPYLTEMFNCHINGEVCPGLRCVKYIHKYIYKGHDRATMVLGRGDEIKQYLDSRYIGPPEAAWHLFSYDLHEEYPNVVRLDLHLPGEQFVAFDERDSATQIEEKMANKVSKLMGFFLCCAAIDNFNTILAQ